MANDRLNAVDSENWKNFRNSIKTKIGADLEMAQNAVIKAFALKGAIRAFDEKYSSASDKLAVMETGFQGLDSLTIGNGMTKKEMATEIQKVFKEIAGKLETSEISEIFELLSSGKKADVEQAFRLVKEVESR